MTLIGLSAAALIGIAIADIGQLQLMPLLLTAALGLAAAGLSWRRKRWRMLALLTCAAALGAARGSQVSDAEPPSLPPLDALSGLVSSAAALRAAAQAGIYAYLPEPQASLAAGVLLGGSGHLSADFRADLQRSGLGHLVAIDGFKQVVVAATIGGFARRLVGPRLALLPSLSAIAAYTVFTGAHPSAVRAALMVTLASLASLSGRVADPLTSLGVALLGMAAIEPRVLLDLGLQLSLSATLGIVLLWPVLRRKLRLYRLPRWLSEPIGLSLAVSLACLPITLRTFQLVSLASPLAHVLAVPLLPAVLLGATLLALAAATPVPALASAAAWLAWLPTWLLAAVIHAFGNLPGAAIATGRLPPRAALLLAGALLLFGVSHMPELREARLDCRRWQSRHRWMLRPLGLAGVCLLSAATLQCLRPDGQLHVERLDLPRGQALFVRGPTGRTALVVLGSTSSSVLAAQVAEHMRVWEHRLDVIATLDEPASAALGPTLARYPAGQIIGSRDGKPIELRTGDGQLLYFAAVDGRLSLESVGVARSAPTTSAARPGSAD
jgi:competence protein ComEC